MRNQKGFGVWSDLVDDSIVLLQNEFKLVVVRLEFIFLEKNNLGTLWDINSDSGQALSLSDKGKDLSIEVDIELVVFGVTDNESGLKTGFSFLNFVGPLSSPEILEREQGVTNLIVHLDVSLKIGLLLVDQILWELFHWA